MSAERTLRTGSVLAITSGKGGVGKTNVAVNVSLALARFGHRVGLIDADYALGNVDVMLGLTPDAHIGHLLNGERTLRDVIVDGPLGMQIVPAASGPRWLTALTNEQRARLTGVVQRMASELDFVLVDTCSGISDNVIETLLLAGRVVIVTSLEPAAVVDAYALVKVMTAAAPALEIGVVVNGVRDAREAQLAHRQMDLAATRFLNRGVRFYGFIPDDVSVREAVLIQRPIVDHLPQAPASRCFRVLASRLASLGPAPHWSRPVLDGPVAVEVPQCA
jgi:flagellar biosynthesis protein FlhG